MRAKNGSLAKQISFITLINLVLCMTVLGVFSFAIHRSHTIHYNEEKALAIAEVVAANIDAAEFESIMAAGEKNQYWYTFKAFADETKRRTGVQYLYILANTPGDGKAYFAEGYNPLTDQEAELEFGDVEDPTVYSPMMFEALDSGRQTVSGIYPSGDFGKMVSGFSPIVNQAGKVVGVVGVDLTVEAVMRNSDIFGLLLVAAILIFGVAGALIIRLMMERVVGRPIGVLTTVSQKMAVGDMDINVDFEKLDNEIGRLSRSFQTMVESSREQVRILDALAGGDLTVAVSPRCERDGMSIAMAKMIRDWGDMFNIIQRITAGVSAGAADIAAGSGVLARGSGEQAATMDKLTLAIGTVTEKAEASAALAGQAAVLTAAIRTNAEQGASQMASMVQAVKEIDEANKAIANVINSIDDIARQTNLLALNAAVEAARAGQQGKGFAVVADEVRVLAAKSAASAKNSAAMIDSILAKAAHGVRMAEDTAAAFDRIVQNIDESGRVVSEIARASREQSSAIGDINQGIEHVDLVVQQNTATSEESAAAAGQLSDQARDLQSHTSRFKLRG